jgi:hypothetical protein
VDGFDENDAADKGDDSAVISGGFLASQRDPFESL